MSTTPTTSSARRSAPASTRCVRACRPMRSPTTSRRSSSSPARPGRSATQATTRSSAMPSATTWSGSAATHSLTGVGGDTSNDTMIGGLGDDTYHLDSAGDGVIENAGEGSDLIISEAPSYTLPSTIEAMFLGGAGVWGFGNESDNTLAGGTRGNFLFGRGGNDYLNGGGGADYLEGGAGADVFLFTRGEANGDAVADFTPRPGRLRLPRRRGGG